MGRGMGRGMVTAQNMEKERKDGEIGCSTTCSRLAFIYH